MFNRKLLSILAKTLGILILFGAAFYVIAGFFIASAETVTIAEKVGFFIGYQLAGLSGLAFLYLVIGALANINESIPDSDESSIESKQ